MIVNEGEKKLDPTDKVYRFSDVVKMKVAYPKDYAKKKHLKDGDTIEVHVLQAEELEAKGIAKIIK
jgi:hypothetical protein